LPSSKIEELELSGLITVFTKCYYVIKDNAKFKDLNPMNRAYLIRDFRNKSYHQSASSTMDDEMIISELYNVLAFIKILSNIKTTELHIQTISLIKKIIEDLLLGKKEITDQEVVQENIIEKKESQEKTQGKKINGVCSKCNSVTEYHQSKKESSWIMQWCATCNKDYTVNAAQFKDCKFQPECSNCNTYMEPSLIKSGGYGYTCTSCGNQISLASLVGIRNKK
jgi:hypothetical protein